MLLPPELYGGDSFAIKSASHELKGQAAYARCQIRSLCSPMMVLLEYGAHRLLCTPVLPLQKDSLKYGRCASLLGRAYHPRSDVSAPTPVPLSTRTILRSTR